MNRPIFNRYIVPFVQWYLLMIAVAIVIDYFLHRLHLERVGLYLGYFGTLAIILSFVYSLRKRKLISTGSPKQLLQWHEYLAWAGAVMLLVHAGIHFNALLPWLAILMLLIAVASGLIGKFLLKRANESLRDKKQGLLKEGMHKEEVDKKLFFDSLTVDLMKKWRVVHLPITAILGLLALMHIVTIVMFG